MEPHTKIPTGSQLSNETKYSKISKFDLTLTLKILSNELDPPSIKPAQLTIKRLNALKMFTDIPYFPDAYIPLLSIRNENSDDYKNVLQTIQKDDWKEKHKNQFSNFYYKTR